MGGGSGSDACIKLAIYKHFLLSHPACRIILFYYSELDFFTFKIYRFSPPVRLTLRSNFDSLHLIIL
jgi:hypothetical protein